MMHYDLWLRMQYIKTPKLSEPLRELQIENEVRMEVLKQKPLESPLAGHLPSILLNNDMRI